MALAQLAYPQYCPQPRIAAWPPLPGCLLERRIDSAQPVMAATPGPLVPTHPVHNVMRRGLLVSESDHEELVKLRVGGQVRLVRVRTGFSRASTADSPPRDANLLKTHLDLVEQARRSGPVGFAYPLPEALGRLGYKRLAGGGFHPDTTRALADRLALLARLEVAVEAGGSAPAPFWQLEVEGRDGHISTTPDARAVREARSIRVAPGDWWEAISLEQYHAPLAPALLALPMDGNGNEVHRLALLLAAELAVWQRAEKHKGTQTIARSVGALLSKAMVADKSKLLSDARLRLNTAKRLRAYLAGEGFADEGALALLRREGGIAIDIRDEAAFWASGRGWVEKFWSARLAIGLSENDRPLASFLAAGADMANVHRRVGS